ncbi:MAG: ABC transporter ATP-binding protein [Chloroflexota bacterium]|nr:ABC transporter ATP-binding protein [Chloroflexota bacterium]
MSEPAVRVAGLVKRYGDRAVLDGVSFEVAAGELLALLGPNGAGKTTTVEILEGYRRGDSGDVRVLGQDPAHGGPGLRSRVGLMLQGGGIDPRATADEVIRLYAAFHAAPRDPAELIDLVGLRAVARTRYRRLSGGERQRLGLALALVGRPEVLFLDEPTAGMDPAARAASRDLIRDLRADGVAILLTTHDLVDVERLADRVAVLAGGRIVALGTPAELVAGAAPRLRLRFATPLTTADLAAFGVALAAERPSLRVAPVAGDASAAVIDGSPPDPGLIAAVAAWVADRGLLLVELRAAGASLEDRYLELTGDVGAATAQEPEAT